MTPEGLENPTLHLYPGDTLKLTVTNNTPPGTNPMTLDAPNCGSHAMSSASVNVHFHGANATPSCHGDEVVKTVINPGETFRYSVTFPKDEPPGLYWYHPHVHGLADAAVTGGSTGALIIDGVESRQPAVNQLPRSTFVIRDQQPRGGRQEGSGPCTNGVPFRDVTINQVPVDSSAPDAGGQVTFTPAKLTVPASQKQFWRVANASADSILDLQLQVAGQVQPISVIGIDGVPVNSQDGSGPAGAPIAVTHFRLPPASRVEFTMTTPAAGQTGVLMTNSVNTGPAGDCDPARPLLALTTGATPLTSSAVQKQTARTVNGRRFANLKSAPHAQDRTIYFSEDGESFFVTVDGQTPAVFQPNQAPSIKTVQGAVEKWVIQNRAQENHVFHIHQIHFLVLSQDNFGAAPVAPAIDGQFLDTVEVPGWSGSGPYPSVTVLMDFRGAVVGRFVFHCHILNHEDQGMMSIIEVDRPPRKKAAEAAGTTVDGTR